MGVWTRGRGRRSTASSTAHGRGSANSTAVREVVVGSGKRSGRGVVGEALHSFAEACGGGGLLTPKRAMG